MYLVRTPFESNLVEFIVDVLRDNNLMVRSYIWNIPLDVNEHLDKNATFSSFR